QKLADDKAKKDDQRNQAAGNGAGNRQADKQRNDLEKEFNDVNKQPPSPDKGGAKPNQPERSQSKQQGNGDGGGDNPPKQKDDKSGGANQAGNNKQPQGAGTDDKAGESKGDPGSSESGGGQPQADPMKGTPK